jgi:hypothetical protein
MRALLGLTRTGRFSGLGYQWRTVSLSGITGTNPLVWQAGFIAGKYAAIVKSNDTQRFWYTSDLATWQQGSATPARPASPYTTAAFDGTSLLFGGSTESGGNYLASTSDGVTWGTVIDPITTASANSAAIAEIAYGNGILVTGVGSGNVFRSSDLINFTAVPSLNFGSKAFGNGVFLSLILSVVSGIPQNGQLYSSADGLSWTAVPGMTGTQISFAGSLFWLAKASASSPPSQFYKSSDGSFWEEVIMPSSYSLLASPSKVFKSGTVWMFGGQQNATGSPLKSYISHDALNWTDVSAITTKRPTIAGTNQFVGYLDKISAEVSP